MEPKEPIRHIVVFKFKPNTSPDAKQQLIAGFRSLKNRIPGIKSFEQGANNSPENKNLGFTHVFTLTFDSLQARDAYLPHPEHKKFIELIMKLGIVEDVFVVDYVAAP